MNGEIYQSSKYSSNQSSSVFPQPQPIYETDENYRIKVGENGVSAFPESKRSKLLPLCLWDSFKQKHVFYYLVCIILEYFKFCQVEGGEIFGSTVQFILLLICLFLQIINRYNTYENYASLHPKDNLTSYRVWNQSEDKWEEVGESELRVGQIIKVEKYLQGNNKLNPVNLLPLAFASRDREGSLRLKSNMLIKTTRIDKREEYIKIKLWKPLRKLVTLTEDAVTIHPKVFQISIHYSFISNLGCTFEATLSLENNSSFISNADTIPRGVAISTQEFVIGVVLRHTESFKTSSALNSTGKSNKINRILDEYIFWIIVMNVFVLVAVLVINIVLTIATTSFSGNYGSYIFCFTVNLASNLCNVIYIGTYILIYAHRMRDQRLNNNSLNFRNSIKSLDELAQTDTLIMDDYFFLDTFDVDGFQYVVNEEAPLSRNLNLLLKVVEESPLLKEHMLGHTISISRYFQLNKHKAEGQKKTKVKIVKQSLINDNTVQIAIKVIKQNTEEVYLVRFSDKLVASTISSIKNPQIKLKVGKMITESDDNSLIFLVDMVRIQKEELETAKPKYFSFYSLFCFSEEINSRSLRLVKSGGVLKKYNIVILTNKAEKYIKHFMRKGELMRGTDNVISLEEKEEKEMNQIIRDYRKTLRAKEKKEDSKGKSTILFINSSMITYLSRKNIRKSIFRLSPYCKYIVFYSCSQYQKQICAVNLFKIFPDHIFLTNYICDSNILQYSNLSICEKKASSEMLTTIVVNSYNNLEGIIFKEAIKSIQIVYCIINSCIFKNQLLVISHIVCFLLVYRGSSIELGVSFVSEIYFFYNIVFTIVPIVFMIVKRPALYIDEDVRQYLNVQKMIAMNLKTIFLGATTSYFIFSIQFSEFAPNVFTAILLNCIVTSNLFLLFLDDSQSKKSLVIAIFLQIIISLTIILTVQIFHYQIFEFIKIGTQKWVYGRNFDRHNIWFYLSTFFIIPFVSTLILFALSAGKEIKLIKNSVEIGLREWSDSWGNSSQSKSDSESQFSEYTLKVPESKGKQFLFSEEAQLD